MVVIVLNRVRGRGNKSTWMPKVGTAVVVALIIASIVVVAAITEETITIYSTPYTHSNTVEDGYKDVYRIYVTTGQVLSVTVQTHTGDADLFIKDTLGYTRAFSANSGTATDSETITIDRDGYWSIEVEGFYDSYYTITVDVTGGAGTTPTPTPTPSAYDPFEPNNDRSSAEHMPLGTCTFPAYLEYGDSDWFYFTLSSYSHVVIETVDSGRDPDVDTKMWLYDSSGAQIAYNDDGGAGLFSKIERDLSAGTYYVRIESYGSSSGYYSLSVGATAVTTTTVVITTTVPVYTTTTVYYPPTTTTTTIMPTTTTTPVVGGAVPEEFSQISDWMWNNIVVPWIIAPIGSIVNTITSGINTIISTIVSGLSGIISAVFTPIANALSAVGNAIVGVINTIADAIRGVLSSFFYGGGE